MQLRSKKTQQNGLVLWNSGIHTTCYFSSAIFFPNHRHNKTQETKQPFPLVAHPILYSCVIFQIKGEVEEGFKNISSTNQLP